MSVNGYTLVLTTLVLIVLGWYLRARYHSKHKDPTVVLEERVARISSEIECLVETISLERSKDLIAFGEQRIQEKRKELEEIQAEISRLKRRGTWRAT